MVLRHHAGHLGRRWCALCAPLPASERPRQARADFDRVMKSVRDATEGTVDQLKEWRPAASILDLHGDARHLGLCASDVLRLPRIFPTYAIRVFGDDFPVASIFGSLNPAMIIFLVPCPSTPTHGQCAVLHDADDPLGHLGGFGLPVLHAGLHAMAIGDHRSGHGSSTTGLRHPSAAKTRSWSPWWSSSLCSRWARPSGRRD